MNAHKLLSLALAGMLWLPASAQPTWAPVHPHVSAPALRLTAQQASRGFFASFDYLSYNADLAIDARGGTHLVFYFSNERHEEDPPGQPAFYTFCAPGTDCSDPTNFSHLVQFDSEVTEVQIAATPDGRPRLLVRRNGARGNDYHFWSCEEQCTQAANWMGLYVTDAAGVELNNADLPQHSFTLDALGRPRFIYSNSWGNGRPNGIYYTFCDAADCTAPGSWEETTISSYVEFRTVTSDYATLVFDGTRPRVLTRYNESGLPVRLEYYSCEGDCGDSSSWNRTTIAHPEGKMWANWDLALDAAGRPRIALYEAAGIDIRVGGKLFYGWCDAACTQPDAPFQLVQVAAGEGKNVDLSIDAAGRTYLVYDAGQRGVLGALWCDGGCTNPPLWQRQILQTSDELQHEFAPAIPFHCAQSELEGRAWLDAVPTTAFDDQGRLAVAYDVKHVALCYYVDPARPDEPVWTKVERIWWAVRVQFYPALGEPGTPVEEEPSAAVAARLDPNYPNPFVTTTTLRLVLSAPGPVTFVLYDALGREVERLLDGPLAGGTHEITFTADHLPSGVYLAHLATGSTTRTQRLVLLR